ncbi:MAG: NAD(P)-dependent oxidoreductase [Burkholderiales bacterium]
MTAQRIGFIGLGDIGAPMAMRVVDAGWPLTVFNRSPAKAQPFADRGVAVAASPQALAQASDVVLLCVTDADAVEAMVFGANGLAAGWAGRSGLAPVAVDLSTIHPRSEQAFAKRLAAACGGRWVDAPVSGGAIGARAGTLAAMVGGDAADVERVRPVLLSFAGRLTHMGGIGCGQATKLCNQMINCGTVAIVSEAMDLAARFGMDPAKLPEALAGGFADSSILRNYGPKLASGAYAGQGNTLTTLKDAELVLDLGRSTGAPMPLFGLIGAMLRGLVSRGHTKDGMAGLSRVYRDPGR